MMRADGWWQSALVLLFLLLVGTAAVATWGNGGATPSTRPTEAATVVAGEPAVTATATATAVPAATPTASVTPTLTASPTPPPSPTLTPIPSQTPLPTASPTASPEPFATLQPELVGPAAIPTPLPALEKPAAVTNLLLLGNDVSGVRGGRTDSLLLISINRETETATLLSLPRDLYVVIPGWKMTRINQALPHGHGSDYPGGGGALIKDTIRYNLGIPVDYYVRIGFDGFKEVVDALGGVEVPVTCAVADWRLQEPDLDPQIEENWEWFTLGQGVHWMDGELALWYARSRRSSSDFERGRRQQELVQALLARGLQIDVLARLPELWGTYRERVETDLTLPALLQLARLAPAVADNGVQHLYLAGAVRAWRTPGGAAVQLLQADAARPVLAQLMQPPLFHRGGRPAPLVRLASADDTRYRLAEANLAGAGFRVLRGEDPLTLPDRTQVAYTGATLKGTFHELLAWELDLPAEEIASALSEAGEPGPYFQVTLGANYNPCRPQLEAPLPAP